jgi:putative tryptophan/tyrosine transport system substrate-binding protein
VRRREFIAGLGVAAVALPMPARAQQAPVPVVGFIHGGVADGLAENARAFRTA